MRSGTGRVENKVLVMAGAGSDIGRASSDALRREGAHVVLADDADEGRGRELAASFAGRADFVPLDVTDEGAWIALFEHVEAECQRLDGLVICAGDTVPSNVESCTVDEWRSVLAVNLDGVFLGCKHAVLSMRRLGTASGSIVNVSSVLGMVADGDMLAYSASQGGVRLLTKSVALHCASEGLGIRCNSVHPACLVWAHGKDVEGPKRVVPGFPPLGRMGRAEEVASVVVYLVSDESAFVTGAEHLVDGGYVAV